MNTAITIQNRIWLPLLAAGTALALAVGLLTYVLLQQRTETATSSDVSPAIAAPTDIPQAEWKVKTVAGGGRKISKAQKARVDTRAAKVTTAVQTIYDTLYLDPTNIEKVLDATFTKSAAAALAKPGVGLPAGAEDVETTRRRARVTVYAETASQAIADVLITLKGVAEEKPFELAHEATLWLQRGEGGWKVIAYEITQEP